jgi:hypothetical protein
MTHSRDCRSGYPYLALPRATRGIALGLPGVIGGIAPRKGGRRGIVASAMPLLWTDSGVNPGRGFEADQTVVGLPKR